jgi:hypothetical protein
MCTAFGVDQILGHGVVHAVGAHHHIALAQLGIAADLGPHVGLAGHMVTAHIGGQLVLDGRGQLFQQLAAGLELQRRQITAAVRGAVCAQAPEQASRAAAASGRTTAPRGGAHRDVTERAGGSKRADTFNGGRRKIRGHPAGAGRFVESDYP